MRDTSIVDCVHPAVVSMTKAGGVGSPLLLGWHHTANPLSRLVRIDDNGRR